MFKEKKLKFYADKPGEYQNKLCVYDCKDSKEMIRLLKHYKKNSNTFRAVWFDGQQVSKDWISNLD